MINDLLRCPLVPILKLNFKLELYTEKFLLDSASSGIRKRASCHGHTSSLPAKRISVITPNASSERSSQVSTSTGQPHGYPVSPIRFSKLNLSRKTYFEANTN